jgi:enterochelin esterase family protein
MKHFLLVLLLSPWVVAQNPPPDTLVSPEVHPDRRVTFRVRAPKANEVTFTGDWMPTNGWEAMKKDAEGIWSVTLGPLPPSIYLYTFSLDGVTIADPVNPRVKLRSRTSASLVEVPDDPAALWQARDVPHGKVEINWQRSTVLNGETRWIWIYTPPGYTTETKRRYPVLYLFHGSNDVAAGWTLAGCANLILDNLLAEKKAVPMIVVMPSGWTPSGGQVMTADATKDPFNDELLKDIIPFVEATYRTPGTADTRALSGLSMGGIQTLNIGLHNLGTFRYLAVMSSGWTTEQDREFFYKTEAAKIPKYNSALKLFWWGWGETDIARANGLAVIETFKSQGVRVETRESPGGHTWDNWRLYLYEVAPKLFR